MPRPRNHSIPTAAPHRTDSVTTAKPKVAVASSQLTRTGNKSRTLNIQAELDSISERTDLKLHPQVVDEGGWIRARQVDIKLEHPQTLVDAIEKLITDYAASEEG